MILSERTARLVDLAPQYYEQSKIYEAIQNAYALELDLIDQNNQDLLDQLDVRTATWGLKYWEDEYAIKTIESDTYPVRRSRIIGKRRGIGNFSAALVKSIAQAYSENPVTVSINLTEYEVTITFIEDFPNVNDFRTQLEDIIHAHMGYRYVAIIKIDTSITAKQVVDDFVLVSEWSQANPINNEADFQVRMDFLSEPGKAVDPIYNGEYIYNGAINYDEPAESTDMIRHTLNMRRIVNGIVEEKGVL
jgi:uncharacterized protein YmfQ (DUF2313 family)